MKIFNCLLVLFFSFILISCSKVTEPVKKISVGTSLINYQGDQQVESLIIPPDLTAPNTKGIFTESIIKDTKKIVKRNNKVEVKRDNFRRWLVVDMSPEEVWPLSKEFFRSFGFLIEKENQSIGILETDYLEKATIVPEKSLGPIRAALAKALKTSYGMPTADKYRVRIEPLVDPNKSEVYLTLSSIGEVTSGEMRLWQPSEKDLELETEMLLSLMVFLGSDEISAATKIQAIVDKKNSTLEVLTTDTGFASLIFPHSRDESWRYLGWALDELGVDIEDRDIIDGSYYIKVTPEKGFLSKIISSVGSIESYQLYIKQISNELSQVYFVNLSQENSQDSINYSFELFNDISSKFLN
jgi:outer membrane protein assembly factor BamC